MKRFTIQMTEEEHTRLEDMMIWYYQTQGIRLSKCALIKQLLFGKFNDLRSKTAI